MSPQERQHQSEALIIPPMVDETATKDEVLQHLSEYHRNRPYGHTSKTTKAEFIRWHGAIHETIETGTEDGVIRARNSIRTAHDHRTLSAEDVKASGGVVLHLTKPLTSAEAKDLRGLIDNDFNALAQDMKAMAADTKARRLADAEAEWTRKIDKSEHYRDRARKLLAGFDEQVAAVKEKALTDGIELSFNTRYSTGDPVTVLVGKTLALQKIASEVQNDLNRALLVLERQRLAAHRTVILAKITPEAHAVLKSVPNAKTLMIEAARERQEIEVEA